MDQPYSDRREILEGLKLDGPAWQISPAQVDHGNGKQLTVSCDD
jgi:hypothetical protein